MPKNPCQQLRKGWRLPLTVLASATNSDSHFIKSPGSPLSNRSLGHSSSPASPRAFFQSKKTSTAQFVDCFVLDGTKAFCKSCSSSLDKKLKCRALFSLSFGLKLYFFDWGLPVLDSRQCRWHFSQVVTLGQEHSWKLPRQWWKQSGMAKLISASLSLTNRSWTEQRTRRD